MKINVDSLKFLMIEKKLSLKELSQKTGLSQITLAAILKSDGELKRYKTAGALIEGLNVNATDILTIDN